MARRYAVGDLVSIPPHVHQYLDVGRVTHTDRKKGYYYVDPLGDAAGTWVAVENMNKSKIIILNIL